MARGTQVEMLLAGIRDTSGNPLFGGKVYAYEAGSSTPKNLYTDVSLDTAAANPVVLDSSGQAHVYGQGSYKLIIKDSDDVTLYTFDNLYYGLDEQSAVWGGTASGTANAIVLSANPPLTAYSNGMRLNFIASAANTGAATVNIDSQGAKSIKRIDGSALQAGDIISGSVVDLIYDGTNFILLRAVDAGTLLTLNDTWLRWLGSGGSAQNVLKLTSSDHVHLNAPSGKKISMRVADAAIASLSETGFILEALSSSAATPGAGGVNIVSDAGVLKLKNDAGEEEVVYTLDITEYRSNSHVSRTPSDTSYADLATLATLSNVKANDIIAVIGMCSLSHDWTSAKELIGVRANIGDYVYSSADWTASFDSIDGENGTVPVNLLATGKTGTVVCKMQWAQPEGAEGTIHSRRRSAIVIHARATK